MIMSTASVTTLTLQNKEETTDVYNLLRRVSWHQTYNEAFLSGTDNRLLKQLLKLLHKEV
jgi:hypothetical protein